MSFHIALSVFLHISFCLSILARPPDSPSIHIFSGPSGLMYFHPIWPVYVYPIHGLQPAHLFTKVCRLIRAYFHPRVLPPARTSIRAYTFIRTLSSFSPYSVSLPRNRDSNMACINERIGPTLLLYIRPHFPILPPNSFHPYIYPPDSIPCPLPSLVDQSLHLKAAVSSNFGQRCSWSGGWTDGRLVRPSRHPIGLLASVFQS